MKYRRVIIASVLAVLTIVISTGCNWCPFPILCGLGYQHPYNYYSRYSSEEHITRISNRTKEIYAEEIEKGELANFTVDILYAFYDNDPEFFLVEFEYAEEFEVHTYNKQTNTSSTYTTKYKHVIGYIQDDDYFVQGKYAQLCINLIDGRSSYTLLGYSDAKKYYSELGVEAVETEDGLLQIYYSNPFIPGIEFDVNEVDPEGRRFTTEIIDNKSARAKELMKHGDRFFLGVGYALENKNKQG